MADISETFLLEPSTGSPVAAELWDEIQQAHMDDWQAQWVPARRQLIQDFEQRGVPKSEWPQSRHWNWERKAGEAEGVLGFRTFAVVAQGVTQGLMRVKLTGSAKIPEQRGAAMVYVDFLEVAPWNWPAPFRAPRLKGVGLALMTAAVTLSLEEGFKGRIGLHSLPQSKPFYETRCGMTDMSSDPDYENLTYFEMTPAIADAFLR